MRPNHAQRLSLNIDSHLVIDAGAGTGKTKTIVDRVIEHYLADDQRATRLLPMPSRPGRLAAGAMTEPTGERVDLSRWGGLIPPEVVVLTFTNLAAEELRHRLRHELARLQPGPTGESGGTRSDSRIPVSGLPEQLRTLLEDAPIGTIDSFLNRLVAPHRARLSTRITRDQVSDAERTLLEQTAVRTAWRLSSEESRAGDAVDAGISPLDATEFFAARARLTRLHGRDSAPTVVASLLHRSVFVEAAAADLDDGNGSIGIAHLRDAITRDLNLGPICDLLTAIEVTSTAWLQVYLAYPAELGATPSGPGTRAATLTALLAMQPPTDVWDALRRIYWHAATIFGPNSVNNLGKSHELTPFPRGSLPKSDGWGMGHNTITKKRIPDVPTNERANEARDEAKEAAVDLWQNKRHKPLLRHALIVGLLDGTAPPHAPSSDWPIAIEELPDPIPSRSEDAPAKTFVPLATEARILQDLLTVHRGTLRILERLKEQREVHDFDDISNLAADLLLAKCPSICRTIYSGDVINALDEKPSQPWLDEHIDNALALAERAVGSSEWAEANPGRRAEEMLRDLQQRVDLLHRIRRRFRAMIIDEAQDVNPRQWMLLSRLWGRRHREEGESAVELEWEPTICYVGDVKQSIYLFRQAQVTAFQRNILHLRRINSTEVNLPELQRTPLLRDAEWSRDPRYDQTGFLRGGETRAAAATLVGREVRFDADDAALPPPSSAEIDARREGHVGLRTNYRTHGGLLRTMNSWWTDIFAGRHRALPNGDWYAEPQSLFPSPSNRLLQGRLEWLLPVREEGASIPRELTTVLNPFQHGKEDSVKMQNTLIAGRIRHLVEGLPTQVRGADGNWETVDSGGDVVAPRDIMVLMPSRTIRDDLVERLRAVGVPAQADREGALLDRPAAAALHALLQAAARPWHHHHIAWLARSPLLGLDDGQLQILLGSARRDTNLLRRLVHESSLRLPSRQVQLIERWLGRAGAGRIAPLLEETIDQSDLLVALPRAAPRQDAERFVALVREMESDAGGDIVLLADRMRALQRAGNKAIEAETVPPSNAVRLMTIHASKGLQSKVVIVANVFGSAQTGVHHEYQDRLVVSPRLFASHPKPWADVDEWPFSGIWEHGKKLNAAQKQAEARRLLYVAATRAEEHLIFAGAPKGCSWQEDGIQVNTNHGQMPTFGAMLLESLRQNSIRALDSTSPWLQAGDEAEIPITEPMKTPDEIEVTINPVSLLSNSHFGEDALSSMAIYHDPACFSSGPPLRPPLVEMGLIDATARDIEERPPAAPSDNPRTESPLITISPHRLDLASSCIRRHWLEQHIGLSGDAIRLPIVVNENETTNSEIELDGVGRTVGSESPDGESIDGGRWTAGLPAANSLGTIIHRVLELGIESPTIDANQNAPLPTEWTAGQPSRLTGDAVDLLIDEVFAEMLPADADADVTAPVVREMLARIAAATPVAGADGVRTEWAFTLDDEIDATELYESRWTPDGEQRMVAWESVRFRFSGVVDLVIASPTSGQEDSAIGVVEDLNNILGTNGASGTLHPIDLKTEDAFMISNPPDDLNGTLLEERAADGSSTSAERDILHHHRLQLTLYWRALKRLEDARKQRGFPHRSVQPPAVLVGLSGRTVRMSIDQLLEAEAELDSLLGKIAVTEASDRFDHNNFPRLPASEASICRRCPFHMGALPICGPLPPPKPDAPNE